MIRQLLQFIVVVIVTTSVTGCMNVATTGASCVYNRHSLQKSLHDQYISAQAYHAINGKTNLFKDANVVVAAYNDDILLTGQVPEVWQRAKAEELVKQIPDVGRVYNQIQVESPSSTLTKLSDAWITSKIKAKFMASDDVDVTQIKVVTENGAVYLMGTLQPYQAQAAIEIASETEGVSCVVKMFRYVRISRS